MSSKVISLLICFFILHLLAAGRVSGCDIGIYELKKGDFSVKITNYGARIISVFLPDKNGMSCLFFYLCFCFNFLDLGVLVEISLMYVDL